MLEVNRAVLEGIEGRIDGSVDAAGEIIGQVTIEAGAEIRGSRIVGPVVIGANTLVIGSYVGPSTSIAPDCRIESSETAFSIVLAGATVQGVRRIESSLIGRDVEVTPATASVPGRVVDCVAWTAVDDTCRREVEALRLIGGVPPTRSGGLEACKAARRVR